MVPHGPALGPRDNSLHFHGSVFYKFIIYFPQPQTHHTGRVRERDYQRFLDSERAAAGGVMALDSDPERVWWGFYGVTVLLRAPVRF